MPPSFCASATTCRATVVLPEDSGPKISEMRPRGKPPIPSAKSTEMDPEEIAGTATTGWPPRRITEPLPNCFSIWLSVAPRARARSFSSISPRAEICPLRYIFPSGEGSIIARLNPDQTRLSKMIVEDGIGKDCFPGLISRRKWVRLLRVDSRRGAKRRRMNLFRIGAVLAMTLPCLAQTLTGAIDMHMHADPDGTPRKIDAIDLAKLAKSRGMRAIVLKNHYEPTASLAYIVRKEVPGIEVFGGISLDLTVGGVNPAAVEWMTKVKGHYGRVVWLPTFDSEAQVTLTRQQRPFARVTKDGKLVPEVRQVI